MKGYVFDPTPVLASYRDKTDGEVADLLGVTRETVCRWRNGHRRISTWRADELALHIGTHPALLWPDEWCRP